MPGVPDLGHGRGLRAGAARECPGARAASPVVVGLFTLSVGTLLTAWPVVRRATA
ncbi:hypothetical protein [Rhodococcus sp. T7]|uniref:hypothetical protein n=1 Tax=Rhodococcus sp. T7 TaxID=627444 RepID=UPI00135A92FF|nr:hypothetical protein [Rhodococcus sp. T7]